MKLLVVFILVYFSNPSLQAQVGFGTINPDSSAAVDITDTARGLLIPRMSTAQKLAIRNPATGLMIYQTDSVKGFWYYDGVDWKNINASPNYNGKHTIVLTDSITNSQAQAKITLEFGPNTQEIGIQGCLNLTAVDLSMVTRLVNITINDNPVLTNVNLANLKNADGYFSVSLCPALTSLNVSSLETIVGNFGTGSPGLTIQNTGLLSINFPKLRRVIGYTGIDNNPNVTSVSFPLLQQLERLNVTYNPQLTSFSCSNAKKIGSFSFGENKLLSVISFPALTDCYLQHGLSVGNCPNLSSVVLGNLSSFNGTQLFIWGGKLSSTNVNALLNNFANIMPALTNRTIYVESMTPPAPPTGQGIVDKDFLIANGNSVTTD